MNRAGVERWQESYIPLEKLRRACPLRDLRRRAGRARPCATTACQLRPQSFELRGFHFVGGIRAAANLNDGHNTGLYTFSPTPRPRRTCRHVNSPRRARKREELKTYRELTLRRDLKSKIQRKRVEANA